MLKKELKLKKKEEKFVIIKKLFRKTSETNK